MLLTPNLSLKKPEGTDTVNIDDINSNMDILDTAVTGKETPTGAQAKVDTHANKIDNPHGTTATQVGAIPTSDKGAVNGVASLDGSGKVPSTQLAITPSPRSVTLVVSASNSSASGKASADYVCDGVSDEVEINNAINALPTAGGRVVLLEGLFTISTSIVPKSNTSLEGQGNGTVITLPNGFATANFGVIKNSNVSGSGDIGIYILNLKIDGNKVNATGGSQSGISLNKALRSTVQNVTVENMKSHGIYVSTNGVVGYNLITGNHVFNCTQYGIGLGSAANNVITDNIVQGTGLHGINIIDSSNNMIKGNMVLDSSQTTNVASDNISLSGASNTNSIQGNTCRQGALTNKPRYGINVSASTCTGNMVTNNDLTTGGTTGAFSDVGTSTVTTSGNKLA
jgi:parallel beta-helix repeat protein